MKDEREEIWQHLVRYVIKKRIENRPAAYEFLRMWEENHKSEKLRVDVQNQWNLGNRGDKGDWR